MLDLLIRNVKMVLPEEVVSGSVGVVDGKIAAVFAGGAPLPEAAEVIDGGGLHLMPGGVDAHVHIRYPGSPHRETFETGTRAAAAGGTTTIVEHPISTPPQYNCEILNLRGEAVLEQAVVDVAFLGAAGGEFPEMVADVARGGIFGYKTFLHEAPEGREKEFRGLTSKDNMELLTALRAIAKTGLLAAAHTEDNDLVSAGIRRLRAEGRIDPLAHADSRPPITEILAVQRLLSLAKEAGTPAYLVHISCPEAVELARAARSAGQEVYIETCPQYLFMDDSYLTRHGVYAKCNPALRKREDVERMWQYVLDGTIDVIASDHAPYTREEKENSADIFAAPAGFPGLETRMPLVMRAVADGRLAITEAAKLLSTNPAAILRIPNKGAIRLGYDADFVLIDMEARYPHDHHKLFTKARDIALFLDGEELVGRIHRTVLRGRTIYDGERVTAEPGSGRWLKRI